MHNTRKDKHVSRGQEHAHVTSANVVLVGYGQWVWILSTLFAGCCSNVFTLEAIVQTAPGCGHVLTFCQFLFVSVEGYLGLLDCSRGFPYVARPRVPISCWLLPVVLYYLVSVLNNHVWIYHISVPTHIIFRSGGTLITMVVQFCAGKRYTWQQVCAVVVLTVGVIVATLGATPSAQLQQQQTPSSVQYAFGVFLLFVAAVLTGVVGYLFDNINNQYGVGHWREKQFYTHVLSLPLFLPLAGQIRDQWASLRVVPHNYLFLLLNCATQYLCVRGVNKLASRAPSLSVSIVLNVRKFVSLVLSILIFRNPFSASTVVGAFMVFAGTALFTAASGTHRSNRKVD